MNVSASPSEGQVLTFRVGTAFFGLPLEWICAIEEWGRNGNGDTITGRVGSQGSKLPVLDLASWLGEGRSEAGTVLIFGRGKPAAAVRIGGTGGVKVTGEVRRWPAMCRAMVEGTFTGVMVEEDRLVLLLDPEGLLRAVEQGEHGSQGGAGR